MKRLARKYVVPHESNSFRPYLLRAAGVAFVLVFILGAFFASQIQRIVLRTSDFFATVLPAVLVDLANADRAGFALGSLSVNSELAQAAQMKADDMAAKGYFAHYGPDGTSPWDWIKKAGYQFSYAGENLAVYFDDSAAVNTAWMDSPSHRANILNEHFKEIGIATARGVYEGHDTLFVVQMFGTPRPASVAAVTQSAVSASLAKKPTASTTASIPRPTPVASSTVLGESSSQTFVAVENKEPSGDVSVAPVSAPPQYASRLEHLVSSPTHLLAIAYIIISLLLLFVLAAVLVVRHDKRTRHTIIVIMLLILIAGIYCVYHAFVVSEVSVLVSERSLVP